MSGSHTPLDSSAPSSGRGPQSAAGVVGAGAVVGAASVGVNGLAYLVPLLATRLLPDTELGALSALLAVGAVAAVIGIGLQTALAVRWARHSVVAGTDRISLATTVLGTGALVVDHKYLGDCPDGAATEGWFTCCATAQDMKDNPPG